MSVLLFIICNKQDMKSGVHSQMNEKRNGGICSMEYCSASKNQILVICNSMGNPGRQQAKSIQKYIITES